VNEVLNLNTNHIRASQRHKKAADVKPTDLCHPAYVRSFHATNVDINHNGETASFKRTAVL
jgi:hypothetical protein